MIRFLGHHVPFEMLCLWVLEVGVLSALICALMLADVPPSGAMTLSADVLNSAVVLAATVGATTFAIGLYRPEVFLKTRRLLLNTAMAGILALPVVWVVSSALGIDVGGLLGYDALWPLKICVAWIALLFATRVLFRIAIRRDLFVRRVLVVGPADVAAGTTAAVRAHRKGFLEAASPQLAQDGLDLREVEVGGDRMREEAVQDLAVAVVHGVVSLTWCPSRARDAGHGLDLGQARWRRPGAVARGPPQGTPGRRQATTRTVRRIRRRIHQGGARPLAWAWRSRRRSARKPPASMARAVLKANEPLPWPMSKITPRARASRSLPCSLAMSIS